jgi:UDP-glucose 4-epimerase
VLNVGGTTPTPILELAGLVQETMGIPQPLRARFVPYDQLPGRYQDVRVRIPDTTKAERVLGFRAQVALREGLERTLAWHVERRRELVGAVLA